ncbi:MAG: hypothetical protein QM234_08240 [Acidobacteriota bacterium]|nr:hypothetical protein [Acidobacteriota bacterium]
MPIDYTDYSSGFNPYSDPITRLLSAGGVISSFLPGLKGRIAGRLLDALSTTRGQYQQAEASQQQLDRIMQLNNEMRDMGNDAYGQMIQNAQNYNQYLYSSLGGPMAFNPASMGYGGGGGSTPTGGGGLGALLAAGIGRLAGGGGGSTPTGGDGLGPYGGAVSGGLAGGGGLLGGGAGAVGGGATGGSAPAFSPDPNDPWATIYGAQSKMYQDWNQSAQTPINYMNQALSELKKAGTAERNEIERGFQQGQSTAQQAMAARGLTNTSAYGNMLQGWEQRKGQALAGLEGQLGQMRSGVISQFAPQIYGAQATALANMGNALATYQNAAQGQASSAYSIPQSLIGSKLGFDTGLVTNAQSVLGGMNLMPPDLTAAGERQQGYGYHHGMQQAYQASQPGWLGGLLGAGTGVVGGGLLGSALLWPVLGPVGGFGAGALVGGLGGYGIGHSFD